MQENKIKIGIVGWSNGEKSFGASKSYLDHLSKFGDIVILTPTKTIYEDLDMIFLPGGKDTNPFTYGEVPGYYTGDPDIHKEFFMNYNLPKYIDMKVAIFGTCLGFQQLIVHFGGKLIQNLNLGTHGLSTEYDSELVNDLEFSPEFLPLEKHLKEKILRRTGKKLQEPIKVCSRHHQGILAKNMPEQLITVAYNSTDRIVEAFIHENLPIAGGQMHTEDDNNPLGNYLIREVIKKSKELRNANIGQVHNDVGNPTKG